MTQAAAPALNTLRIDRTAPTGRGQRHRLTWVLFGLACVALAAFMLWPGKTAVQVTSVLTTYPSQQYAQLTASGYVVAQRRAAVASKATGRQEPAEATIREVTHA